MRLIDADALELNPDHLNRMNGVRFCGRGGGRTVTMVQTALKHMIENAPTIDAEPVRNGRNVSPAHYSDEFTGSACGFSCEIIELRYDDDGHFGMGAASEYEYDCKFCPNFGAKMNGGTDT